MPSTGDLLASIIDGVIPRLAKISDVDAAVKPAANRWSAKEILGHLVDSAANNHRRFVLANLQTDLVFDGYPQEEWVATQGYQERDWNSLIQFWQNYNQHLAFVITRLPTTVVMRPHVTHSLHQLAWKPIPADQPATLDYLIKDYVGHLEHHIRQILPTYQPVMIGTYEYGQ